MQKRYYHDIKDIFKNSDINIDPLIYEFDNIIPNNSNQDLLYGTTTIYPGNICGEYYMTKGHTHNIESAEVYYGIEGSGLVYEQTKDNVTIIHDMSPGKFIYINPGSLHRVINNSNNILRFLTICRADAGHNYNVQFSTRFFSK